RRAARRPSAACGSAAVVDSTLVRRCRSSGRSCNRLPRLVVSALFAALLVGCTVVPAAPAPSATALTPALSQRESDDATAVPTATALATLAVSQGEREDATAAPTAAAGADNVPTVTTPTTATTESLAQKLLSGMTLEQRIGQ